MQRRKTHKSLSGIETFEDALLVNIIITAGKPINPYQGLKRTPLLNCDSVNSRKTHKSLSGIETTAQSLGLRSEIVEAGKPINPYQGLKQLFQGIRQSPKVARRKTHKSLSGIETKL